MLELKSDSVPPIGFEPMTYGLENRCSIQLSYGGINQMMRKDISSSLYQQIYFEENPHLNTITTQQITAPTSFQDTVQHGSLSYSIRNHLKDKGSILISTNPHL